MEKVEQLISKAEKFALADNWGEEAIKLNAHILELNDKIAGAYTRLARCFKEQENWLGAREMYRQVLSFEPGNRIALNNLPYIERKIKGKEFMQLVGNIDSYEEAFAIGVACNRKNEPAMAIVALSRAIALKWTTYAQIALAAAYRYANDLEMAEKLYKEILTRDNNNLTAKVGLAAVYRDKRWFTNAEELYENVLLRDPENCYALNGVGGVYSDLGMLSEARECFEKALKIGKEVDESIRNLEKLKQRYLEQNDSRGVTRIDEVLARFGNLKGN